MDALIVVPAAVNVGGQLPLQLMAFKADREHDNDPTLSWVDAAVSAEVVAPRLGSEVSTTSEASIASLFSDDDVTMPDAAPLQQQQLSLSWSRPLSDDHGSAQSKEPARMSLESFFGFDFATPSLLGIDPKTPMDRAVPDLKRGDGGSECPLMMDTVGHDDASKPNGAVASAAPCIDQQVTDAEAADPGITVTAAALLSILDPDDSMSQSAGQQGPDQDEDPRMRNARTMPRGWSGQGMTSGVHTGPKAPDVSMDLDPRLGADSKQRRPKRRRSLPAALQQYQIPPAPRGGTKARSPQAKIKRTAGRSKQARPAKPSSSHRHVSTLIRLPTPMKGAGQLKTFAAAAEHTCSVVPLEHTALSFPSCGSSCGAACPLRRPLVNETDLIWRLQFRLGEDCIAAGCGALFTAEFQLQDGTLVGQSSMQAEVQDDDDDTSDRASSDADVEADDALGSVISFDALTFLADLKRMETARTFSVRVFDKKYARLLVRDASGRQLHHSCRFTVATPKTVRDIQHSRPGKRRKIVRDLPIFGLDKPGAADDDVAAPSSGRIARPSASKDSKASSRQRTAPFAAMAAGLFS